MVNTPLPPKGGVSEQKCHDTPCPLKGELVCKNAHYATPKSPLGDLGVGSWVFIDNCLDSLVGNNHCNHPIGLARRFLPE